jgi:hypothetical protein
MLIGEIRKEYLQFEKRPFESPIPPKKIKIQF